MPADLNAARLFQTALRKQLDAVPPYRAAFLAKTAEERDEALARQDARNLALHDLKALIEAAGGTAQNRWDGARVRLYGLTASSTTGLESACRNWLTQVTLKSAAASMGAR